MRASRTVTYAKQLPSLPPTLWVVMEVLLGLSVLSVGYCFLAKHLWGLTLSHYFPLSPKLTRFSDFYIYEGKFPYFHTQAFFSTGFPFTYPAAVALVYEGFFRLAGPQATAWFVAFSVLSFLVPALAFGRVLSRRLAPLWAWSLAGVLLLTAWPAAIVIDRGNMEVVVWLVLLLATWSFCNDHGYRAAALFGVAAAMKLFPFVFMGLFLSTREYRKLLTGVGVFVGVSLVSLAVLGPTVPVAYHGINDGLHFFKVSYMAQWRYQENGVDHSLFALVKGLMVMEGHSVAGFDRPLSLYFAVTALTGFALFFWRIRLLPLNNQILAYAIISIYFTAFSGDGTLLHLYYPFAILIVLAIEAQRTGRRVRGLRPALVLLAVLVAPISFLYVPDQRFEGEVKCALLGVLLVYAMTRPFGPPLRRPTERDASLAAG